MIESTMKCTKNKNREEEEQKQSKRTTHIMRQLERVYSAQSERKRERERDGGRHM